MKKNVFILALLTTLLGFTSCISEPEMNRPDLYVVNGSDYSVQVYCDNHLVTTASAHSNSGRTPLIDVSINIPVFVEAKFYDKKGEYVGRYSWNNYYFTWNASYKMTLQNSGGQLTQF